MKLCNLANIFFVLVLMPFVSPYPVGSDVQPLVGIVALVLMLKMWFQSKLKFNNIDIFFIFFAILSLSYVSLSFEGDWDPRKRIGLIFAFVVFYTIKELHYMFKFKVFYAVVLVYFSGAVFHLLMPELFSQFAGLFIRVIKQKTAASLAYRGISSFAPEPGFLGALSVFFLLVLHYFNRRERISRFCNWSVILLSMLMLLASKSGAGYVYFSLLLVFFLYDQIVVKRKPLYLWIGMSFLLFNSYSLLTNILVGTKGGGRGLSILRQLATDPLAAITDASIAQRISNLYTAAYSLYDYPMGTGAGTFSETAQVIYDNHQLYKQFSNIEDAISGTVSAFAQYSVEMGLVFILFLTVVVLCDVYRSQTSYLFRSFSIIFLLFTFSIAFPPTWFLLATTARVPYNRVVCFDG